MSKEAKILSGVVLAIVIALVGVFILFNKPDKAAAPTADAGKLVRDNSHKIGIASKVTLVEFGDYQCPACGAAHPTVKRILDEYKDKITFVFRNYPLAQHQNAQIAAEAAEAAAAQNKFWEMHDKLYESQKDWSTNGNPGDMFSGYAKDLGLDTATFDKAVSASSNKSVIQIDTDDGTALGVQGTPTFYLNGKTVTGYSYDELKKALDEALKA